MREVKFYWLALNYAIWYLTFPLLWALVFCIVIAMVSLRALGKMGHELHEILWRPVRPVPFWLREEVAKVKEAEQKRQFQNTLNMYLRNQNHSTKDTNKNNL